MPFHVGKRCFPAAVSDSHINRIARSDASPETGVWEKIKEFFCQTHKSEALECIRTICHPPAGTTREEVVGRFEQLRTLAYAGFSENIQSGQHGDNYFCILDENSREMLTVTLDDAGKYTVKCQGHNGTIDIEQGEDYTERAEGGAETLRATHAAATAAPQTAEEYEAIWSAWEKAAPPEEATDRANVVEQLRDIQNRHTDYLHLNRLRISSLPDHLPPCIRDIQLCEVPLTSLPELPHGLTTLMVERTPLTSLPKLPEGLYWINILNTPLTSLPELPHRLTTLAVRDTPLISLPPLPDGLTTLMVSAPPLTRLPELPHGLTTLSVSAPPLTRLPELPHGLTTLLVRDTPLISLPELPHRLTTLMVSAPPLTRLPELPHGLTTLMVERTPLTSLPPLPPGLTELFVSSPSLTRLPESIAGLSPNARVDISDNPLSEHTRQALEAMNRDPDYSGPTIHFSMAGPSIPRETRALHLAVADWLTPAKEGEPAPADRWQAFGRENEAASFSSFMDRLSETENLKKNTGFKTQISSWLTQLAEDDELRAKTFAMATEATSSCEDRVTLALNDMKNVQLVHNAEKGKYDNNFPGLVSVGREMFRLEKLEQIAREKVSTQRFVDEIEVYLGYQNKLRQPLELTSVTAEMRFFGVSHITDSDLQAAEIQVKTAENSQFSEWILQWEPLRSVLERTEPECWETLSEKKISDYDNTFRMLTDAELKPAGLVGNTDAERTMGTRAMESAEKAFLESLRPLADKVLGSYLKARWVLTEPAPSL
ncbi:E3 ubiquitin--protein ligase [Citrobacter freundii]|nr:E3 ubiquitin--protein ligase [Citrobacter freundii]